MWVYALLSLLVALAFELSRGELFTSNAHLQTALYAERDIAGLLQNYVEREEIRLQKIRELAAEYSSHSNSALADVEKYLGNPINAFLLIKKFTMDWDRDILPIINNSSIESLHQEIDVVRSDLPKYEDLKGAAAALMRLQDTYQLDTTLVAHGQLGGISSPVLSASECFTLARLSYTDNDFYHCSLWMREALDREKLSPHSSIDKADALDYLSYTQAVVSQSYTQAVVSQSYTQAVVNPTHERATNNKRYFEKMMLSEENRRPPSQEAKRIQYQESRDSYRNSEEFLTYEALCRGEDTMPIKDAHRLTCRYVTNGHPLLILQPAKEEEMHLDPWIVVYHDIMSDAEIRQIKRLATPRLNRATVQNSKTGELETAHYRISKSAWLKGEEDPVIEKINNRMQAVTGLDLSTAEELQIANYGLGGHYEPHYDFARKEEKEAFKSLGTGNRIATFLSYMSDVQAGGATVFPYLGLKLYPKKGDAAFWYNLHRSGDGIHLTRHAACPVLVGIKWVANKWIHERGQEFRRPCGLEPDE
ncbi:hypothetical protein EGW08_002522 [Elysia chlorotica]|uniref:procollagen-proline 4-dioxygenase n=1 Tax=Elysia chlorotica TaxID=188477 RepID=A0A3S0ZYC8_ELYCH|nr:hypothetical protein EGW08_002522 [Elysia chlorotica]